MPILAEPPIRGRSRHPRSPGSVRRRKSLVHSLPERQPDTQRRPWSTHQKHPLELRVLHSPPEFAVLHRSATLGIRTSGWPLRQRHKVQLRATPTGRKCSGSLRWTPATSSRGARAARPRLRTARCSASRATARRATSSDLRGTLPPRQLLERRQSPTCQPSTARRR